MIPFMAIILALCVLGDALLAGFVGEWRVAPQLAPLFLLYLALRRPFSSACLGLVIDTILTHPLTGASAPAVFASHFVVLGIAAFLRRGILAEAYLTQALWAAIGVFILHGALVVLSFAGWAAWRHGAIGAMLNGLSALIFAIPVFMACDSLLKRRRFSRRREAFS